MKCKALSRHTRKGFIIPSLKISKDYPWKILGWLTDDLEDFLEASDVKLIREIVLKRDFDGLMSLAEENGLQSMCRFQEDVPKLRATYLVSSLLKKYRFNTEKETRISRAKEVFLDYEEKCRSYNLFGYKEFLSGGSVWSSTVLFYAKGFLSRLLGAPGHLELTEWSRHGPGTSLGMEKGLVSSYHKYSAWPYTVTSDAVRYARFVIETDRRWYGALQDDYRERFKIPKHFPISMAVFWNNVLKVVDGNRITFVPKNAKIERSIAIEPTMNLYLQLGVDGYIRRRLKRWGVDLDTQEKNQSLAREGSVTDGLNTLVTLDLKGASDTVSLAISKMLLPPHWYAYLMDLRSPKGDLNGESISYEKISSMGNGYTFALESAIFTALIYAVYKADGVPFTSDNVAVYGDDLIIRKAQLFKIVEALRLAGFSINLDKSFTDDFLRESCGTDWFKGKPVRPIAIIKTPSSIKELWGDINRLRRILELYWSLPCSKTLSNMEKWIPESLRCFTGPMSDEEFDTYLHMPNKPRYGKDGYVYRRLISKPINRKGHNFLFRKLMHNLRPSPLPQKWDKTTGGSRFNVYMRDHTTLSISSAVARDWQSTYTFVGYS